MVKEDESNGKKQCSTNGNGSARGGTGIILDRLVCISLSEKVMVKQALKEAVSYVDFREKSIKGVEACLTVFGTSTQASIDT